MAKVTGSYESLIRGVSEQVPQDRLPGQHWTQDNFISDPVRGLARRHGSVLLHQRRPTGLLVNTPTKEDAKNFKEQSFYINGNEYSISYRTGTAVANSTMPGIIAIDKDAGVILPVEAPAGDGVTLDALDKGLTSITTVGQFVVMAPRTRLPQHSVVNKLAETAGLATAQVRGGAFSRKYTITVTSTAGHNVTVNYTTPASYYAGSLSTSDIPTSDPDYQKKVNDRVNAYNTAVNQHLAFANTAIQPEAIANSIFGLLVAYGWPQTWTGVVGSTLVFSNVSSIVVNDNGDGTLFKACGTEVDSLADLTSIHLPGKTVRVVPRGAGNSGQSYYLRARAATTGQSGWGTVIWEEAHGWEITPSFVFLFGWFGKGKFYVASTAALLESITGLTGVPRYEKSAAGDGDSSPVPDFLTKRIDYVRTFQDRLMIVSGATVFMSKSGDYFNFFRKSALAVADDDPIEVFAEGSEGDVITDSVQIDRNLILFGRRQQYALPGREVITPRTAYIAVQSSHEDATDAAPIAAGQLVFFAQARGSRLTVQQMQTGSYADSFDSFDITTQLDGYMSGTPKQLVAMTSPQMLFIRTRELENGVYVYSYLDSNGSESRLYDSWSRWTWNPGLGQIVTMTRKDSSLLVTTLRQGTDGAYLSLDQFSRETTLSSRPYLDSQRDWLAASAATISGEDVAVALKQSAGQYFLAGRLASEAGVFFQGLPGTEPHAVVGAIFTSSVEPTSPYMRDDKDRAVMNGRLVVSRLNVTVSDSGAMRATMRCNGHENLALNWVHRPAGEWKLNVQQIADTQTVTVPVMKDIREYRLELHSRNWLPVTISSIEWSGQFFTSRKG